MSPSTVHAAASANSTSPTRETVRLARSTPNRGDSHSHCQLALMPGGRSWQPRALALAAARAPAAPSPLPHGPSCAISPADAPAICLAPVYCPRSFVKLDFRPIFEGYIRVAGSSSSAHFHQSPTVSARIPARANPGGPSAARRFEWPDKRHDLDTRVAVLAVGDPTFQGDLIGAERLA